MGSFTPTSAARALHIVGGTLLVLCVTDCSKSSPFDPATNGAAVNAADGTAAKASGYGSGSFYPLAVGNSWTYAGWFQACHVHEDSDISECLGIEFTETRRLIGMTQHEGTSYLVEEQVQGPWTWLSRLRQDRFGLHSLDAISRNPPVIDFSGAATATGDRAGNSDRIDFTALRPDGSSDASLERFANRVELMREAVRGGARRDTESAAPSSLELRSLSYPLHPGTTWSVRPDSPWPAWVDGVENLETPAGKFSAYRIGVNPPGAELQDGEWIYLWYSREGYLGYSIHTFMPILDVDGQPTGDSFAFDESMRVSSMEVAR